MHPDADGGISLRQAARIAGFSLLVMTVLAGFAETYVYPKLAASGHLEGIAEALLANSGLLRGGILCYLLTFVGDVLVAWALYILLKPVNSSLSLLAAWFRLVHALIAAVALLHLVTVLRVLSTSGRPALFGPDQMDAQVKLLMDSFRYGWSVSLVFFGIHLAIVGYLVYRSAFIPKILGPVLAIAGIGHLTYSLGPYVVPGANLGFLVVTFFGEMIFILWLLIRGPRIRARDAS